MPRTFRPRLVPTLATLVGLGILVSLGTWQYNRYEEKLEREAEIARQTELDPIALDTLPISLQELNYRTVTLTGTLDMSHAVLFKHRQHQKRPGYWLAAPLVLDQNRAVWANLGWLPFDKGAELANELSNKPQTRQAYTGLFYILPQNIADSRTRSALARGELDSIEGAQTQWYTYDIERLLTLTPYEMGKTAAVLVLDEAHSGDPFPIASNDTITKPYMTAERHKGYFLFWYSTAGALLLLYIGASFGVIGSFGRQTPKPREPQA